MTAPDKIALVTGAAKGIGYAIAERFAAEGAMVVLADVDEPAGRAATQAIAETGARARFRLLDVTDPNSCAEAVSSVTGEAGRLDVLVNNAGITNRARFLEFTLEEWEKVLRVNLTGTFLCAQAAARAMVQNGGGRIINIASISGQHGGIGRTAYGASKAGIINLTKAMAMELAPHGITVNAISPGPTMVARMAHGPKQREAFFSRMALKRYGAPADIAAAASFLAFGESGFITGHTLNVDGGFNAAGVLFDPDEGL